YRTKPIVLCASSRARVGVVRLSGRHLQCQSYGRLGTRYRSSKQVIPFDVNQSQISVPSPLMANPSNPPPGNTTAATPVFSRSGENTVMVGRTMLVHSVSGPGAGCASGDAAGQIGTCTGLSEGCSTAAGACKWAPANPNENITGVNLRTISPSVLRL